MVRFLPVIFWLGLVLPVWSAPPPVGSPVPLQFPAEPASGGSGVVPVTASSPAERVPLEGTSFPVRLPPVGYQPTAALPLEPPSQRPAAAASHKVFAAAQIIAVVGDQFVLAGDLMPQVEMILEATLARMEPEQRAREAENLLGQRDILLRRILDQTIETKMLYVAFLQSIPESRRVEAMPMIKEQTERAFEESLEQMIAKVRQSSPEKISALSAQNAQQVRLAKMLIASNSVSLGQLDLLLRRYGSSLEQEKRYYAERSLGRSIIGSHIDRNREVTHQQMLDYYREHADDYKIDGKVRWERLSVHFSQVANKNAAYRQIAAMGNEVLRGAPFAAVAKRSSQGLRASEGGRHDWTSQGSLRSEPIEKALWSLPLNRLSQIIEDDRGFHIVRAVDRAEVGYVSFGEAQKEIKEIFAKKNFNEQVVKFIAKLRDDINVWTIYDDGPMAANPSVKP